MARNPENAANSNTPQQDQVAAHTASNAVESEEKLLAQAWTDKVERPKDNSVGEVAYDEGISQEHFGETVRDPKRVAELYELIESRMKELEAAYRKKGYTISALNALNDQGKLPNFRSVHRTLKEFDGFLGNLKNTMQEGKEIPLSDDVIKARQPHWVSLFPLYQELMDDLNALPENVKPVSDPDTKKEAGSGGGKKSAAAEKVSDVDKKQGEKTEGEHDPAKEKAEKEAFVKEYQEKLAKIRSFFTSDEVPDDAKGLLAPLLEQLDELEKDLTEYATTDGRDTDREEHIRSEFAAFRKNGVDVAKQGNGERIQRTKDRTVEEQAEYQEARKEWKTARDAWTEAKREYAEALQKDENRNVFKRFLGIGKMPPGEFEEMEAKYKAARQQYAQALSRSFNAVQAGRGIEVPEDKNKQLFFRKYVEKEAKSIVDIQTSALEGKKQNIFFKAAAAWSRKPKWVRYIGSAALGSTLALTTGGGSLASYAVRFGIGVTVGKMVGEFGHEAYYSHATKGVKKQERVVTERGSDTSGFDISNIDASESGYRGEVKRLSDLKRRRETGAKIAGAASAFAAGGFIAGNLEVGDMGGGASETPPSGSPPSEPPSTVEPGPPVNGSVVPPGAEGPPESGLPEEGPIPPSRPEAPFESEIPPEARYEVQPDDNVWNIMKERYADMLNDLPTEESRRVFLDTLKDYLATEEASREALGVGPNINLIHPGQVLDFSSMDTLAEAVHNEMLGGEGVGAGIVETELGESEPESAEGGLITHVAAQDDNGWNIMEGWESDENPIGGKSEVLHGMSQVERENALNILFAYMDKNPEFTKEVGFSSGDPDKLALGEKVNVSMMDEKLRELLGMDAVTAEDHAEAVESGPTEVEDDLPESAEGESEPDSPDVASVATPPEGAWVSPEVLQERNEIIQEVESTQDFFGRNFGLAGSYEKLQNVSWAEIETANSDPAEKLDFARKYHVSERAFEEWMDWTEDAERRYDFPQPRDMTFGEYVTAVAERRVPQGTVV
ncbi:MAG: hypothetical protein WDZ93_00975 [Candidatus Paceibacterota bacterium]